jgi:NADPH2:quinone reductase
VLGVAGTAEKASYAAAFGYDEVFAGTDWDEKARATLEEDGIDVVFDSIGGEVRERGFQLLAPLGRIVFYGNACDAPEIGFAGGLLRAEVRSTMGFSTTALSAKAPRRARQIALRALEEVREGRVRVPVTGTFPLAEAGRAHELLEGRATTGKLLLEI